MKQNNSHRWTIVGLWFVFILPFISATLLYCYRDHFEFKLRHSGELLTPALESKNFNLGLNDDDFFGKWQIVYLKPTLCQNECENKIKILNNIRISLGKDQDRVVSRSIPFSGKFSADSVVIIDPKGWLILQYNPELYNPKGILEDLKRLLRFSRA